MSDIENDNKTEPETVEEGTPAEPEAAVEETETEPEKGKPFIRLIRE